MNQKSATQEIRFFGKISVEKTEFIQWSGYFRFLALGFQPLRLNFVIDLPFWGQVRSHHSSLCHRLAFLGPGEKPPRFNFVVGSSFWS
jgi:hypothetical protein